MIDNLFCAATVDFHLRCMLLYVIWFDFNLKLFSVMWKDG